MSLEAHDVWFSYPRGPEVLGGRSLTVAPGERVALTAPSGTGKTTLCRVLAGYLVPRAGSVTADGAPVASVARRGRPYARAGAGPRAGAVQLIWQHPEQAFDPIMRLGRSIAEGLPGTGRTVLGRREDDLEHVRSTGLLERFGIQEAWLARLPHELSGGELMRCCIVRALLAEPRYLICDEMTAMLDAVTQAAIWHEVMAIAEERAMGLVVVSHSPALIDCVATRRVSWEALAAPSGF